MFEMKESVLSLMCVSVETGNSHKLFSAPLQSFGCVVVVNKQLYFCAGGNKKGD